MRTIITSLLALVCLSMVSCADSDDLLIDTATAKATNLNDGTRTNIKEAYVRIGMYADINGYDVRVKNLKIENCMTPDNIPVLGSNITNAEMLPKSADKVLFDNEDGRYNVIGESQEESWVIVSFDVEMTASAGFESRMVIENVKYFISPKDASWKGGEHYDYVIGITADFLGLSAINFDANIEDFQTDY